MMGNNLWLQITPAGENDFSELHPLASACFDSDWTWLNSIGILTLPNILRFKAVDTKTGKLIGFISSEIPNEEAVSWILCLCVDPVYRRMGVAHRLLAVCELTSKAMRYRLCVRRSNQTAQRLYEQVGYQQVGVWANYYVNEDAFVFEKKTVG